MMWATSLLLLILVHSSRCDREVDQCRKNGPDDCTFRNRSFCRWKQYNWEITSGDNTHLLYDVTSGNLESRLACATNEMRHYLKFEYYLEATTGDKLYLTVQYILGNLKENITTEMVQKCGCWRDAVIGIQSLYPFTLKFEARRANSSLHLIGLRNFSYFKRQRKMNVTLAITIPEITSPTLTTEEERTTCRESKDTTSDMLPNTPPASTTSPGPVSAPANVSTATKGKASPAESANNIATVVGAVVAVVVVIGVGILVFFLCRRNELQFWKILLKDGKTKEHFHTHASHNAVYNVDITDPDIVNGVKVNPSDPNYDYHPLDTGTARHPSGDYCSVIKSPAADSSAQEQTVPQYSTGNQTRKTGNGKPLKGTDSSDDNPYEIKDDTVDFASKQPSRRDDYNNLKTCIGEQLGGSASASPANGEYNFLGSASKGTTLTRDKAAGLYHCLGEDPETQGPRDGTPLYHHLEDDPEAKGALGRTGQYHCLEEDPETHGPQYGTPLYHYMDEDPQMQQRQDGTGVYHCLEEDPETQGPIEGTEVYHCLEEDPETQGPRNGTRAYILEQDPAVTTDFQIASVYDVPKGERNSKSPGKFYVSDAAKNPTSTMSDGQAGEYNSLNFSGKNSAPERRDGDSGKVYSHLNEGDEDAYSEVDREKRREIIDSDYSHIK